ncbi:DNA methylase [Candidatus Aerophobetes bacterium]|uniref:Methyltransferase n=1 Tax=Aerophobetes bacterium TaxID=2030807 RepID=A0A662D0F8_UNCAE|nr:MAG: DNA methylase [Candidatus Aerophobetes bacterium]
MPKEIKNKKLNQERLLPLDLPTKDIPKGSKQKETVEDEKPPFETTTLWDYPKQSYGKKPKGNNRFQGVTPAFIIWNMIQRYTKPGDLVVDPMAGSGTTIDVCEEEKRKVIGYDINPQHPKVIKNDSRKIPLEDNSVDMVFIDSPYGDNVNYSDDPRDIGKISAEDPKFYEELEKVAREIYRILKPGKVMGWLIGDQWVKRKFTPVGFKIYEMLMDKVGFEPIDIICVARRNQSSNTRIWHYRAKKFNFFLRGFKYLIIGKKPEGKKVNYRPKKIQWKRYK